MRLMDRIIATARQHPTSPALQGAGDSISYAELDAMTAAAATRLTTRLRPGDRVALSLAKSPAAILVMLACLRAGLTYVPVDPAAPLRRRLFQLQDSGAAGLIVDDTTAGGWPWAGADNPADPAGSALDRLVTVIGPGRSDGDVSGLLTPLPPGERPAAVSGPAGDDQAAYILYTSGSTGDPKGVVVTHGNAEAFVDWAVRYTGIGPGDRVAVHAPLHFDLPVLDIYAGLGGGATICPVDAATALFPQALLKFLRKQRISVLYAVPSALIALLHRSTLGRDGQGLPDLRLLLYAGEEFHPGPLSELMAVLPSVPVHNLYGPIETNVVTALRIEPEHLTLNRIPIGRPASSADIFLLAPDGNVITEPGTEGEIVVAGPTMSPGYLNQPSLTRRARTRVRDGASQRECHRTGDHGSWGPDGSLRFHGRTDGLVKTRGYRVELGEIEAALTRHPRVREAAVVAIPHPEHTSLLYAWAVVATRTGERPAVAAEELSDWCADALPGYMVPQTITVEAELPRTSTGKIARRELAGRMAGGPS